MLRRYIIRFICKVIFLLHFLIMQSLPVVVANEKKKAGASTCIRTVSQFHQQFLSKYCNEREKMRIQAKTVVTGNDQKIFSPGYIIIDRDTGRITDIGEGVLKESEDDDIVNVNIVLPGFVDIHNHGFGGSEDVLDYWTNPEYTLSRLPKMGVTACLATVTLPGSELLLRRSLKFACTFENDRNMSPNSEQVYMEFTRRVRLLQRMVDCQILMPFRNGQSQTFESCWTILGSISES